MKIAPAASAASTPAAPRRAAGVVGGSLAAIAVALAALAGASGCTQENVRTEVNILDSRAGKGRPSTWMGLPLRTGQLILSEAPGPYSVLFALGPVRFFRFTHAAIIVFEDGEPFVYDMSGNWEPSCVDRPTDAIRGGMRRQRFLDYCRPNLYAEIYDPPPGCDPEKVVAFLRKEQARGAPFDAYFRFDEHDQLFCTEMVELALRAGGAAPTELEPVRPNPSLLVLLEWFGLPTDRSLPAGIFQAEERYVGAVGQFRTRTQAMSLFAAKRELHRRFTDDQRLGYVFEQMATADIDLRPDVLEFLNRAVHLFDGARYAPTEETLDLEVRRLAESMFGPGPARG